MVQLGWMAKSRIQVEEHHGEVQLMKIQTTQNKIPFSEWGVPKFYPYGIRSHLKIHHLIKK